MTDSHSAAPDAPRAASVSLDSLRTLLAFHDEQGVSAAARRLGVSQPVVSRKLDALTHPEACGTILLRRTHDGLRLTEAALATLPAIRHLVRQYEQLLAYWNARGSAATTLILGAGQFSIEHFVPAAVAELLDKAADAEVQTRAARGAERILAVWDGLMDLAIVSHTPEQATALLQRERTFDARLENRALAASPLLVLAARNTPAGAELANLPTTKRVPVDWLMKWELVGLDNSSGIRRQLEERQRKINPATPLTFAAEGGGWNAARGFARVGLGVAILPLPCLRPEDRKTFAVRRLSRDVRLTETILFRGEPSPAAKTLIQALERSARRSLQEAADLWESLFSGDIDPAAT